MKDIIYYLPVASEDITVYFRQACIIPKKYFPQLQNTEHNLNAEFLVLSKKLNYYGKDALLEVVLNKKEEEEEFSKNVASQDAFFLYKPLPISRIRKVYFKDQARKEIIQAAIEINTAFLPNLPDFLQVVPNLENSPEIENVESMLAQDYSNEIKKFDQSLGALTLLKISGEEGMNYSENYFSNLSIFNSLIEEQTKKAAVLNQNKIFFKNHDFIKKIYPLIKHGELNKEDIYNAAIEENQEIVLNKFSGNFEFDKLTGMPYILSILFSYGIGDDGKGLRADSLITSGFSSEIQSDYSEYIAFCYGFYKGYYAFYKSYSVVGKEKDTKFKLTSKLDYYTIESVYQHTFNKNKESKTFEYLDTWCPLLNNTNTKSRTRYQIIDEVITRKKKAPVGSLKYLDSIIGNNKITTLFKDLVQEVVLYIQNDIQEQIEDLKDDHEQEKLTLSSEILKFKSEIENKDIIIRDLQNTITELKFKKEESIIEDIPTIPLSEKVTPSENEDKKLESVYENNKKLNELLFNLSKVSNVKDMRKMIAEFKTQNISSTLF